MEQKSLQNFLCSRLINIKYLQCFDKLKSTYSDFFSVTFIIIINMCIDDKKDDNVRHIKNI